MMAAVSCDGCERNYFSFIKEFHKNNENSLAFYQSHGVLPTSVNCDYCEKPCLYRAEEFVFYCDRQVKSGQKKLSKKCDFSVSHFKYTFLEGTSLQPWEILLFVNHWLQKFCEDDTIQRCLKWPNNTVDIWRSYCFEVTIHAMHNQEPIGGYGVLVEIDDMCYIKGKCFEDNPLSNIWLFSGIERLSKKKFVIPFSVLDEVEDRNADVVLPMILKYIRRGSVIISDGRPAYSSLVQHGYEHNVSLPNHSDDPTINTRTVAQLWQRILKWKKWAKEPGVEVESFDQHFSRSLFIDNYPKDAVHQFFMAAGDLYQQHGNESPQPPEEDQETKDTKRVVLWTASK